MNTKVSQERIDAVKAGLEAGKTYKQVAADLGISRSAVAGTVRRHVKCGAVAGAEEKVITEELVVTETAPTTIDHLPYHCDIRIAHPGVDYSFDLCERMPGEGEDEEVVYKARAADGQSRLAMTQTLKSAVFYAEGAGADGTKVASVTDLDVVIKRSRDPWYRIYVRPAQRVDVTALREALSIHREPDPVVASIASLPADGDVVSIEVPWSANLQPFGEFTIQRYPNRISFEKLVREDHLLISDFCRDVQQSASGRTAVVISSDDGSVVLRDAAVETFRRGRFFGVDIRLQPHHDLHTVIEAYPDVTFGNIAAETLRDAYHAAKRSEAFIRASGVGVDVDRIFDLAWRRDLTIHRTIDDIDADFDRICSPVIEKQRQRREQADRR